MQPAPGAPPSVGSPFPPSLQGGPAPTANSEVVHLVSTFVDTLDALPPTLTRSLSDLKELDAVLSGSLANITTKLKLLLEMMNTPSPISNPVDENGEPVKPKFTPLERLKLLREVTDEARIFRLGGEDKIRVATSTCETIATQTSHLATLSTLLMQFLPPHLLPHLPPPSAPHGYPSSMTPSTALARRQNFDYPIAHHPGQGSTSRMNAALGMVRDHWELTRGRDKERPSASGVAAAAKRQAELERGAGGSKKEKEPGHRHPNQYTKKKTGASAAGGGSTAGGYASAGAAGVGGAMGGLTAVESVRKKREQQIQEVMPQGGSSSRGGNAGAVLYPGMATSEEYNAATAGTARSTKRKPEDPAVASKRRKKGPDASPDVLPRQIPTPAATNAAKPPRRTTSTKAEETMALAAQNPLIDEEEGFEGVGEDDDGDGHTYCICDRVSFGEMIGCDGSDCDREWFHLSCVGLQAIPKGRWFCDDCRRKQNEKAKKGRGGR